MQKNKVVRIIAYLGMVALTVIGLLGVIPLVRSELALGDVCPKIIGIPACFIILICLIFITFGLFRIAKFGHKLFWGYCALWNERCHEALREAPALIRFFIEMLMTTNHSNVAAKAIFCMSGNHSIKNLK